MNSQQLSGPSEEYYFNEKFVSLTGKETKYILIIMEIP
jgi:hypothetical protein